MRKLVDFGGGITRSVSYKELTERLHETPLQTRRGLLKKYFPEEVAAEDQQKLLKLNDRRWTEYLAATSANALNPHRVGHQKLLSQALRASTDSKCNPANEHHHTVSDFVGWIYDLYRKPPSKHELVRAKQGELKVHHRKNQIPRIPPAPGWRPIYIDPLDGKPQALEISLLTVHGRSLYGAPDYVLKNDTTGTVLIVEVKITDRELCSDGWPNLRAQLWAYGHIDLFQNQATDIVLVGEIWADYGTQVSLRQTLTWNLNEKTFYEQNQQLFDAYRRWADR